MNPETAHERNAPVKTTTNLKLPGLTANERSWLERYVQRLKETFEPELKRVLVYGSKARKTAGPESDLDILVIVESATNTGKTPNDAMNAAWAPTEAPGDLMVNHSVTASTETQWLKSLQREMPFQRNVEAEGVQIHPVYRPAKLPPGERPPVTAAGIRNAVPLWLRRARQNLKSIKLERELIKEEKLDYLETIARPAFDAVFFSAMAWCLTRGLSMLQRRNLATDVEQHLIRPGLLDPSWNDRIREIAAAWADETHPPSRERLEASRQDMDRWADSACEFHATALRALAASGMDLETDDDTKSKENDDERG